MKIARVLIMLTKRGYKKIIKVIPVKETDKMYLINPADDDNPILGRERLRKEEVNGKPIRIFSYPQNNKFGYYAWTHLQDIEAVTAELIDRTQEDAKEAYEEINQIPWAMVNVSSAYEDADI